ncbi:MAG: hypothetical protein Q9204_004033 [Flavoplaca sp. TL-2023a]
MAAQSRLALRSSARSGQGLDDLPRTVIQRNHSPVNTKKRIHSLSANHDAGQLTKKSRNDSDFKPRSNLKVYSRKLNANPSSAPAVGDAVTQVAARPRNPPDQTTITVLQPPHDLTKDDSLISNPFQNPALDVQDTPPVKKLDKRSLRSHGGSRFKSELALYFADYDEVLSDEPKEKGHNTPYHPSTTAADSTSEFLKSETRIYIVDEPYTPSAPTTIPPSAHNYGTVVAHPGSSGNVQSADQLESHHFRLNNAERLDFSALEWHSRHITEDPLADQVYFKAHRRAERGEKQHRNREKESAQHEQSQLERMLEELKGQAWLKTMGITGITDSERKSYEPKRTIFIQRVMTLLDKFRAWKEEEKRRKAERERSCTVDEDDVDEEDDSDGSESPAGLGGIDERIDSNARNKGLKQRKSTAIGTDSSTRTRGARSPHISLLPIPVEKPFTSFFSKPYQRESALSGHRRGRQRFAFGQQIPEVQQKDFSLSADWLTRNVLAANARSRRAAKRDHKDD